MVGLSRLTPGLTLLLVGGVTLGFTLSLAAQQPDPVRPVHKEPTVQQQATPPITQDAEKNPVTKTPEEVVKSTPFEYQPSEEISEDLSVSFPVDI